MIWLLNTTANEYRVRDESQICANWYLDIHVLDDIGQDVHSANVTVFYPNATIAESKLTDINGWTNLTLMDKMLNATGEYPVGNYTVEATYEIYSNSTTVNMTDNQLATLVFSELVISEFPSFLIPGLIIAVTILATIVWRRKHNV